MPYRYTSLNQSKREIRLIIFEDGPSSGTSTHLKCKLQPVSLDLYTRYQSAVSGDSDTIWQSMGRVLTSKNKFPTSFYALSYVWGDSNPVCDIEIDGQMTKISQNLGDALLSIRSNTQFRVVWADALCINQGDNAEKSWQVQQMAYLYARAKAVISWLGPATDNAALAMKALEDLTQNLKNTNWKRNWAKVNTSIAPKLNDAAFKLSRNTDLWKAIVALTARPYWTRVWIFQEMACSRQNFFLCGDFQAQDIKYPLYFLMSWTRKMLDFSRPPLHPQCEAMIDTLYRYEHTLLGEALFQYRPPRLAILLASLGGLNATDSRDRVYAVLSMAEDSRWSGITPDYSKSETHVLVETACALLKLNWIEEVITPAINSDHSQGMPSWVPNWSAQRRTAFYYSVYDACMGKAQEKSIIKSIPSYGLQIKLDGYVVGTISKMAESFWEFAFQRNGAAVSPSSSLIPWLNYLELMVSSDDGGDLDSRNGQDQRDLKLSSENKDIIARLLVADAIMHPKAARLGTEASGFYNYVKAVDPLLIWHWQQFDSKPKTGKDFELDQYVGSLLGRIYQNGLVIRTSDGNVGLTSNDLCREGDLVVIFPGKRVPCVLRKIQQSCGAETSGNQTDVYHLVGEAYLHGLMDGQFFKRRPEGKRCAFILG